MEAKTRADLLRLTLGRSMFTDSETKALIEISMLESSCQTELLEEKVRQFKSRFVLEDNEWLDFVNEPIGATVSIDFYDCENLTLLEPNGKSIRLSIRGLGTFSIPKYSFFMGVEKFKKQMKYGVDELERNFGRGEITVEPIEDDGNPFIAHIENEKRISMRNNLASYTPAEKLIYDAMQEIEQLPAHEKMTEAVVLLNKAKDLVSDFINSGRAGDYINKVKL